MRGLRRRPVRPLRKGGGGGRRRMRLAGGGDGRALHAGAGEGQRRRREGRERRWSGSAMGTQGAGRKRLPNRERLTAEDDALNQIAREVSGGRRKPPFPFLPPSPPRPFPGSPSRRARAPRQRARRRFKGRLMKREIKIAFISAVSASFVMPGHRLSLKRLKVFIREENGVQCQPGQKSLPAPAPH